mmetsp:Transcript_10756/g.24554  ORF Transcript_10756/g.24554 Transcript_10756/m.24554 type:complete len:237 (-) Transcript_10756:15-725(-)
MLRLPLQSWPAHSKARPSFSTAAMTTSRSSRRACDANFRAQPVQPTAASTTSLSARRPSAANSSTQPFRLTTSMTSALSSPRLVPSASGTNCIAKGHSSSAPISHSLSASCAFGTSSMLLFSSRSFSRMACGSRTSAASALSLSLSLCRRCFPSDRAGDPCPLLWLFSFFSFLLGEALGVDDIRLRMSLAKLQQPYSRPITIALRRLPHWQLLSRELRLCNKRQHSSPTHTVTCPS